MSRILETSVIETSKRLAAFRAVSDYLSPPNPPPKVVGVGSGSTVIYVAEKLREFKERGMDFVCVPTGFQSKILCKANGLRIGELSEYPEVDITFDGADEVAIDTTSGQLNCIKGGGGCQTQEKIIAFNSKIFVLVADQRKMSTCLGEMWTRGVPLEIIPSALVPLQHELKRLFQTSTPKLRENHPSSKAGPVITDNGNMIIDLVMGSIKDPRAVHRVLKGLPGVVETGLFCGMAEKAYFGIAETTDNKKEALEPSCRVEVWKGSSTEKS